MSYCGAVEIHYNQSADPQSWQRACHLVAGLSLSILSTVSSIEKSLSGGFCTRTARASSGDVFGMWVLRTRVSYNLYSVARQRG